MIMLTKEQLADLLRESHTLGYRDAKSVLAPDAWDKERYEPLRERAIQPLVHRSSGEASQPDCEVDK